MNKKRKENINEFVWRWFTRPAKKSFGFGNAYRDDQSSIIPNKNTVNTDTIERDNARFHEPITWRHVNNCPMSQDAQLNLCVRVPQNSLCFFNLLIFACHPSLPFGLKVHPPLPLSPHSIVHLSLPLLPNLTLCLSLSSASSFRERVNP